MDEALWTKMQKCVGKNNEIHARTWLAAECPDLEDKERDAILAKFLGKEVEVEKPKRKAPRKKVAVAKPDTDGDNEVSET